MLDGSPAGHEICLPDTATHVRVRTINNGDNIGGAVEKFEAFCANAGAGAVGCRRTTVKRYGSYVWAQPARCSRRQCRRQVVVQFVEMLPCFFSLSAPPHRIQERIQAQPLHVFGIGMVFIE